MKATIKNDKGVIVTIPSEYVGQQTCIRTTFEHVPSDMVDKDALIKAHRAGLVNGCGRSRP